jgi:hypothetical protein
VAYGLVGSHTAHEIGANVEPRAFQKIAKPSTCCLTSRVSVAGPSVGNRLTGPRALVVARGSLGAPVHSFATRLGSLAPRAVHPVERSHPTRAQCHLKDSTPGRVDTACSGC